MSVRNVAWLFAAFLILAASGCRPTEPKPDDTATVEGRWKVTFFAFRGKVAREPPTDDLRSLTPAILDKTIVEITKTEIRIIYSDKTPIVYSYEVVERTKELIHFDAETTVDVKFKFPGVFKFESGRLLVCLSISDERPKDFEVNYDDRRYVFVLEKAATSDTPPKRP